MSGVSDSGIPLEQRPGCAETGGNPGFGGGQGRIGMMDRADGEDRGRDMPLSADPSSSFWQHARLRPVRSGMSARFRLIP